MQLELGSDYSSDYMEVEKSEYITTDGEDNEDAMRAQRETATT